MNIIAIFMAGSVFMGITIHFVTKSINWYLVNSVKRKANKELKERLLNAAYVCGEYAVRMNKAEEVAKKAEKIVTAFKEFFNQEYFFDAVNITLNHPNMSYFFKGMSDMQAMIRNFEFAEEKKDEVSVFDEAIDTLDYWDQQERDRKLRDKIRSS